METETMPIYANFRKNLTTGETYKILFKCILESTLEKCVAYASSKDNYERVIVKKSEDLNKESLGEIYTDRAPDLPITIAENYLHLKTNGYYCLLYIGVLLSESTSMPVAIYMGLDGLSESPKIWVRDLNEFNDGRFGKLVLTLASINAEQ